ncbi:hypothetical protein GBAR_LOCUS25859 [Geodia barretti]|uniref:Uncharacterized protein n=1 Tax=Geodia barretti TaxID=519541 RepID=A0AA35XDF5_GEOBA|nr:hypothetical protein GBAR_LOCUS25859 [Geodia barretti]
MDGGQFDHSTDGQQSQGSLHRPAGRWRSIRLVGRRHTHGLHHRERSGDTGFRERCHGNGRRRYQDRPDPVRRRLRRAPFRRRDAGAARRIPSGNAPGSRNERAGAAGERPRGELHHNGSQRRGGHVRRQSPAGGQGPDL